MEKKLGGGGVDKECVVNIVVHIHLQHTRIGTH